MSCQLHLGDLTCLEPKRCGHEVGFASYSPLFPAPSGGLSSTFAPTLVWVLSLLFHPSTFPPRHIPTWDLKRTSSDRRCPLINVHSFSKPLSSPRYVSSTPLGFGDTAGGKTGQIPDHIQLSVECVLGAEVGKSAVLLVNEET